MLTWTTFTLTSLSIVHSFANKCKAVWGPGNEYTHSLDMLVALFPGLSRLQFLITCSMQKWREKTWDFLPCGSWHRCNIGCTASYDDMLVLCDVWVSLINHPWNMHLTPPHWQAASWTELNCTKFHVELSIMEAVGGVPVACGWGRETNIVHIVCL